jgi:hypothetical protein
MMMEALTAKKLEPKSGHWDKISRASALAALALMS